MSQLIKSLQHHMYHHLITYMLILKAIPIVKLIHRSIIVAHPHICLECGSEISRGRDCNKIRHWAQKHLDKPNKNYAQYIVPESNECAKKFLMTNKKQAMNNPKKKL